jgi:hypothetical protein
VLQLDGGRAEAGQDSIERLARAPRRRAQDELRLEVVVAQVASDRLCCSPPAGGQRAAWSDRLVSFQLDFAWRKR